jgi:hypothetical protein
VRVPAAWGGTATERPRYPKAATSRQIDGKTVWFINQFDDDDHKYLRVSFEVLNRSARERFHYEEDQVDVLRQIRDALEGPGGASAGIPAASAPAGGPPSGPPPAAPGGSGGPGGPPSAGGSPGWLVG